MRAGLLASLSSFYILPLPFIRNVALLLSIFFLSPGLVNAQGKVKNAENYLVELQQQAKQKKLSEQRSWHLLLKYGKKTLGGVISEADGMEFFNSLQGKTNPEAELAATLASFFLPLASLTEDEEHPQCRFPARFKWLNHELNFDPKHLKVQECDRLDRWVEALDPVGVTLVFASYFMNNPASMFGHTLIRIDSRRTGGGRKLLDYGANYAAIPDTENALLYALKGLMGFFEGRFEIFPYYTKVQEYNNWESRDLWEYELKFSEDQLNTLLLHLWELGGTYFDYYYFQENCSYHILSLLETANPDLQMKDQFFFSVIPSDTVKIVMEQENLVKQIVYRPAVLSQMNHKRLAMTDQEKQVFHKIVKGKVTPEDSVFNILSVQSKALLLNAYMDYLQYQSMQKAEHAQQVQIPHSILLARSRLQYVSDETDEVTHFSSSPEQGHGADRARFGMGFNNNESFLELAYRPAYHDLMAKDVGYDKDSEIIFLDFKLRYYLESEQVKLDRARVLAITAMNPYDPLFVKPSWRMALEVDTLRDRDCNYCNSYKSNFGSGLSYRPEYFSPLLLFSFVDLKTEFSGHLKNDYRFGGDVEIGAFYDITEDWKIKIAGGYQAFVLGDTKDFFTTNFEARHSLSQNFDLRLEHNRYDQNYETILAVNFYF
jgi:uncharacterized protein DUF4105